MAVAGPIIIVEDDLDDQEILSDAFKEIGIHANLLFFNRTMQAFDFLKATPEQPFIILSDVNLPGENGMAFKRRIDNDPQLRRKSIPFVFFSTAIDKKNVDIAYEQMTVQGFFKKSDNYADLKNSIKVIMDYWMICKHPNVSPEVM